MSTRTLTFSGADLRTKALAVDDDKLVVDASTGNVGVGTASPVYKLDVHGTSNAATYYQNGVELYAQRRWEVDLTGETNTNFYPVELKHPRYESSPDLPDLFPVHFKVFGERLVGDDPYNESTLVGYARGGGYSDHSGMYDVHYRRYDGGEKRFEGLYEGTTNYTVGIVIYMRGGYRYSVLTDATEVNAYTSATTLGQSVFAIKDVSGADVSGTSASISRMVHIAETNEFEKRFISGALASLNVAGNVGIGTTSPAGKLQIRSGRSSIYATDTTSLISNAAINISSFPDQTDYLSIGLLGATYSPDGNNPSAYMQVQWDTTVAPLTSSLLLNPIGGDVGIGTTNPTSNLHVVGDILYTGTSRPHALPTMWKHMDMGRNGPGVYPIIGTQGGSKVYNVYCEPDIFGGGWMCFTQIPQTGGGFDHDIVNLYTLDSGDPGNLKRDKFFNVPYNILSNTDGVNCDILVLAYGDDLRYNMQGAKVGAIWRGVDLNKAFDSTKPNGTTITANAAQATSADGINFTSLSTDLIKSVGWEFSISTSTGNTGAYDDFNDGTGGFIIHTNSGSSYGIYGQVKGPAGTWNWSNTTDFEIVRIFVRPSSLSN